MDPLRNLDLEENKRLMREGQLYYAFTPDLVADRKRCRLACEAYNRAGDVSRRRLVELFKLIQDDKTPLPPVAATSEDDEDLFGEEVWCDAPIKMDYGHNVKFGDNVYVNSGSTWIDTCLISVGARTLIGPNCSFYSGTHPVDPTIRNGTKGPETGKPVTIGEDCWFGGNCIVLPGVTIGKGVVVGAGSVVTKDVPPYHVVAGNPAKVIRSIEPSVVPHALPGSSGPN